MKYDWIYRPNWYTQQQLDSLWLELDKAPLLPEPREFGTDYKQLQTDLVHPQALNNTADMFLNFVWGVNEECFGLDLFPRGPQTLNVNRYRPGMNYGWHRDWSRAEDPNSIKLTAIMNISRAAYEGGDLELWIGAEPKTITEFREPGTIIVFPGFMLHRVTPVESGERVSLSTWFLGPKWR
jgi:PKHD-type hydroxylase